MRISDWSSDVCSSDLGGLAGVIDLQLNRPFNFRDPTVVLGGRANYGERVDKINPQFSLLATDRWDTGIGEIRSEEHTSELQSLMRISYAVFCLKKKNNNR